MKSFPSTLLKSGQSVDVYSSSKSIKEAMIAAFNNAMNASQESKPIFDAKSLGLDYISGLNSTTKKELIDNIAAPITGGATVKNKRSTIGRTNKFITIENPLKFSSDVLNSINKYRFMFKKAVRTNTIRYTVVDDSKDTTSSGNNMQHIDYINEASTPALFNPWYSVSTKGFSASVPLVVLSDDESIDTSIDRIQDIRDTGKPKDNANSSTQVDTSSETQTTKETWTKMEVNLAPQSKNIDLSDCSIDTLVKLSEKRATSLVGENSAISELGVAKYRYIDFMFCRDLGKIPNNHLLTLRKFTRPVGDNINTRLPKSDTPYNFNQSMDVGRLVTWFGNGDNKLEDIIKYNYVATFKQFDSKIQEVDSHEDDESTGIIGKIVNTINPRYNQAMSQGRTGSHNFISQLGGRYLSTSYANFARGGQYDRHEIFGMYDHHKVYEPKNTIQSTHVYEGKLTFSQEFTIKFSYKLRAYDNINPRAAFLDLIGNILAVTYRSGTFWGGSRMFRGAPPNKVGTAKVNAFLDRTFDTLGGIGNNLLSGNLDIGGTLGSIWGAVKQIASDAFNTAKSLALGNTSTKGKSPLQVIGAIVKHTGLWSGVQGMIKNGLGRPAVYALDSLLTGDNVGLWHLTIGNPRNPIMSIGNLIIDKSEITQSGPLGLDDFPTDLMVSVSLKHGRPRDSAEIQKMYTKGSGPIYTPLGAKAASNFYKLTSTKYSANIAKDKNDEENSVFNFIEQQKASTNNNAKSDSTRTTTEQTKIVATSTIASDKSADLVDAANSMLSNMENTSLHTNDASWVYAELGDYLDEVVQTSIELSQPSGEPPLDDATKQQMAADANRYMAQDTANGANGANTQNT